MKGDKYKEMPLAYNLKNLGSEFASPFKFPQARNYPIADVLRQFYPTSIYWERFNSTNEIITGTRGSGKTMLMRMLAFSYYSRQGQLRI